MLRVKAMKDGYYNSVFQEEGSIFNLVTRTGLRWKDKFNRSKEEYVDTPENQFSDNWMELVEKLPEPSDAPEVIYVDKEDGKVVKKSTKKKAVKSKDADEDKKTEESGNSDKVI